MCVPCVQGLAREQNTIQDPSTSEDIRRKAQSNIDRHVWEGAIHIDKQVIHAIETELEPIEAAAEKEGK